uniref:Bromodomain adjacent to zinc finger domain protein 1A n=1 Tax=Oryzias latipes TaxID=8090 RepID=A0A3P9JXH2_ORYLA
MECEGLKELPSPVPVRTRVPSNLFGEALMILEFLRAFGEAFDLKDEFPDGVTLEVLEEALVGSDPEGPLCELLFFFLTAIFQALDEEQEELKDQAEDLWDALDDDSDPTQLALSAVASLAAAWPQLHQGSSLKQLDLDSCTLSEILRLHILASGADSNHGNAKFRYQKQGGFTVMDDPCVELRLAEPALLKKLSSTPVYDLTAEEKLKILKALVGKLLTLASSRDLIEDCVEEQKAARQELREIRAEQHRRGREEAAHRVRLRKEEKLREQELRMKEKEEKLKEQEGVERLPLNGETTAGHQAEDYNGEFPSSCKKEMKAEGEQKENKPLPPPTLTKEELEKEQEKVRELQERIQKAAACTCLLPLGRDRMYRRYWILPSASALFVEDDYSGLTEDMLQPRPKPSEDGGTKTEEGGRVGEEGTTGSAASSPAPPSGDMLPVNRPNVWSFYSSMEAVDQLIEALNPRGHRESSLKEALLQDRERLQQLLSACDCSEYTCTGEPEGSKGGPGGSAAAESVMEGRLRDLLLDLEDRVHQGTLGSLKVLDRQVWRAALEAGNYELLGPDGRESVRVNGQADATEGDSAHLRARDRCVAARLMGSETPADALNCVCCRLQELRADASCGISGSGTPQVVSSSVRILSQALADIEQGIERRFLKPPLGEEDSKKDHKMKKSKKKEEDQASDDGGSDSGRAVKTVLERWRDSLQACSSLSQVFVHLSSLERSILWSRSILNARCRICRRKGDADNMLLCDGCDRGHHTHCLRPRLKSVPEGDWFCPDCRPKQRSSRIPSRQRSSIDEEEDESQEEVEEDDSEEEEDSDDEEDDEEEEEEVVESSRKSQAPPPKGKTQSAPSKAQQTTPKSSSVPSGKTSKSSGKKTTPPKSKSNTDKAPPRSGRTSARLSHESSTPTSKAKTSPDQKKSPTDSAPPKPSRAILSPADASSSSRRSSGRNHGVHELSACEQLTVELVRHEDSWPFMKLVSKTQVPDYYDIIKKPIALSTIREKVNNCQYQSTGEFICDVELMFSNCLQYNPRHTNEAKAGVRLQQFFHSQLSGLGLLERSAAPPSKRPRH